MKVSDILRVKGTILYTAGPDDELKSAVDLMADKDIGSLVVMSHGDLVGMLTFREVIARIVANGGTLGSSIVRNAMDDAPLTCTVETDLDEVRRMMLDRHARYMPVWIATHATCRSWMRRCLWGSSACMTSLRRWWTAKTLKIRC